PSRQADARAPHLLHGRIASDAAEDEEDRRQQVRAFQQLNHVGAIHPLDALGVDGAHRTPAASWRTRALTPRVPTADVRLCAPVAVVARTGERTDAHQLLVHRCCRDTGPVVEKGKQVVAYEYVLLERHGTNL